LYQVTQRGGRRCSAADACLAPARRRQNLTIVTRAQATKVLLERGRAIGVEYRHDDQRKTIHANAEVIVSGGAIHSPKLLMLSGIGPGDELRRCGIPVVHDLAGVGRNLQDHLNVPVLARARFPVTYDGWSRVDRLIKFGLQYLLFNSGFATSNL